MKTRQPATPAPNDAPAPVALPENVLSLSTSGRSWNGVRVEITEFHCAGVVVHRMDRERQALLSVVLEEVGGRVEPRRRASEPCPVAYMPRHMHFAPEGMEAWGFTDDVRFVKDANLYFDLEALRDRLGCAFHPDALATPRLRFSDMRLWTMVKLLADAVNDPDPSAQLYGDGLTAAIASLLFAKPAETAVPDARALAPWQLRRVIEYMNAYLPGRIELAHLAAQVGMSQAHFSRAFKASTGLAPYHWQLDARIRRAQSLLLDTRASLQQVAESTGFADAVHFGRTFRKFVGISPAAWRQQTETNDREPAAVSDW